MDNGRLLRVVYTDNVRLSMFTEGLCTWTMMGCLLKGCVHGQW